MTSDRERIHKAFENLNKDGIEARENFMCCQSCGSAGMPDDKPFVFWHEQSHERAFFPDQRCWCCCECEPDEEFGHIENECDYCMDGCTCGAEVEQDDLQAGLYLYYGTYDGEGATEVGEKVRTALEAEGLGVMWNGHSDEAICVVGRYMREAA